jgi:uncharacterized protein YndB with AHSA1/START domain
MSEGYIAAASVTIGAPASEVWRALTDPGIIRRYYFGTEVSTTWEVGSPITWHGEWKGKGYDDKGVILEFDPPTRLSNTHFSPLSGQPDEPQNYHTLTYDLDEVDGVTTVSLTQDNAASPDEAKHDAENWFTMLEGLKAEVERA